MIPQSGAYLLALTSAILFSGASVIFARFSKSHSSLWMNFWKNFVAGAAFCLASACSLVFTSESFAQIAWQSWVLLVGSGLVGLALGDYFLFRGYQRLGSARTIMVFSFSPLFLTLEGYFFFGQTLNGRQGIAILLMMACVWTLSFEKFRNEGHWEWQGILFAIIGVLLDNIGIVMSRQAFDLSPQLGPFTANAIRAVGSLLPLFIWVNISGENIWGSFRALSGKDKASVLSASFFGTFLSLTAWLTALKIGHIGSLAGVGSFNPVAASLWEWALLRKRPTPYLIVALVLFLCGFSLLFKA